MRNRIFVTGLVSAGLLLSAGTVAVADGGSGFTAVPIGTGQVSKYFEAYATKGSDVVMAQNTITPGGFSGWHSHPGVAVLVMLSGELTIYGERTTGGECRIHTYTAGQVFIERPAFEQNAVNTGTVNAVVAVTFFNVPHGASPRIDRTPPSNCP